MTADPDRLSELDARVNELEETLTAMGKALAAEIDERTAAVDALAGRVEPSPAGGDGSPSSWAARATSEQWRALTGWVDWLVTDYQLTGDRRVAQCWPAHPGVVEEFAALHGAWTVVTAKPPPGDALVAWHESLHRLLPRVTSALRGCKDGHTAGSVPRCHDSAFVPRASG